MSFSRENLLLILSIHCAGHLWSSLAWLCDISELININGNFDWDKIMSNAGKLGIRREYCSSHFSWLGIYLEQKFLKRFYIKCRMIKLQKENQFKYKNF